MKDLISVIIPVYNVEKYIAVCLDSIIKQSYENLQIILVNDGSTDTSGDICDDYAVRDNRIEVIHTNNGGQAYARNVGIKKARGEFISFVDSDDFIDKRFIEIMHNALINEQADIAECKFNNYYEGETPTSDISELSFKSFDRNKAIEGLITEKYFQSTVPNKFFRKKVIDGVLFEEGKIHEDILWPYLVFKNAGKVLLVENKLYFYLQRQGSTMHSQYSRRRFDALDAQKKRKDLIENDFPDLYIKALDMYIGSCLYHYQTICRQKEVDPDRTMRKEINKRIHMENIKVLKKQKRKLKYQIWFNMFMTCPDFTSFIRNKLKIGL